MPLGKYFLLVGTVLSLLLYCWSEYLGGSKNEAEQLVTPISAPEVFHPTPAPPISVNEQVMREEEMEQRKSRPEETPGVAVRTKTRLAKTNRAHKRITGRNRSAYAYVPNPKLFWSWR